ncbi:MAG: recombinase family protein, partial [Roseomonas sp.]|nr:recombinase family protein [Roseomonas sp.]
KIAASRARGMWMGGPVPLGYRVENRKLLVDNAAAATVRRVFEGFAAMASGTRLLPILHGEGLVTKTGKPFDKGALYKLLFNRIYLGQAVHKGTSYPGEHAAIVPQELWDRVHAVLQESPRVRAARSRGQTSSLLRGLLFGSDGRAMSPTHTRKKGRLYRYYVSQAVLQGGANDAPHRRLPAGEIEAVVLAQVRALLRQPEVIVGTWRAARAEAPDLTEAEVRDALGRLDPLWEELFPAEQERIIRLLVERVTVGEAGAEIKLNLEGIAGLARDVAAKQPAIAA